MKYSLSGQLHGNKSDCGVHPHCSECKVAVWLYSSSFVGAHLRKSPGWCATNGQALLNVCVIQKNQNYTEIVLHFAVFVEYCLKYKMVARACRFLKMKSKYCAGSEENFQLAYLPPALEPQIRLHDVPSPHLVHSRLSRERSFIYKAPSASAIALSPDSPELN